MNEHSPLHTLLRKKIRTCECSLSENIGMYGYFSKHTGNIRKSGFL